VSDGLKADGAVWERYFVGGFVGVPAQFVNEETRKVEALEQRAAAGAVEWHGGN
jgi:hypothetical protein